MSSIKVRNMLLATFAVLTVIFGSLSAYEFAQLQQVRSSSLTNSTITVTLTPSTSTTVPEEGLIGFYRMGDFSYKMVSEMNEGESITFEGVTFTNLPLNMTYTGASVHFFKFSFQDGSSEVAQINLYPTAFEPGMYFTNHTSPRAGVIYSLGDSPIARGIYLLVQD